VILLVCINCATAIRVIGEADEIDHLVGPHSQGWPDGWTCCQCEQAMTAMLETDASPDALARLKVIDLDPMEAYAAVNGLGYPPEQICQLETLRKLLTENTIAEVKGDNIPGTTRCRIEALVLSDGTKVYLGASEAGALVYRIRPPFSYAERISG